MSKFYRVRRGDIIYLVKSDDDGWQTYNDAHHFREPLGNPDAADLDRFLKSCDSSTELDLGPGEHYARICRGGPEPDATEFATEWLASMRVVHMLGGRLKECFRFIEPVPEQREVYSHELRMLFLLACMEVESACKAVLRANGATRPDDRFTMDDYRRLEPVMRLSQWKVALATNPNYGEIAPFAAWSGGTSAGLPWYQAHHQVKHGREQHLDVATLGHTIEAVAAAVVMHGAQFGSSIAEIFSPAVFPAEEFYPVAEPEWSDAERYLVMVPNTKRSEDPFVKKHVSVQHHALR